MMPIVLTAAFALVQGTPFVPVGGHHGVNVFYREGAPTIELMAEGEIDAPPAEVEAVLIDYGAHRRIVQHLAESRVLASGNRELFVYQRLKLPVISDRDFTLHVTWEERGATRSVHFNIENERGPRPSNKAVRMSMLAGTWELEPIRNGRATRAIYHFQIDFAGSVPRWMVSGGAAKDLPSLYEGVRHMVAWRRVLSPAPILN